MADDNTYAIFGLGNPGRQYADTKHNAGAMVVDILARRHRVRLWRRRFQSICGKGAIEGRPAWLIKPRTYMNRSGWSVAEAVESLKLAPERLLVISDDLDLPSGKIRLREKGSAGGHRGLQSIIEELGTQNFARLRIGVGAPTEGDAADYVLSTFDPAERSAVDEALERAADAVEAWLAEGAARAMTAFND
ncbi:MAG: aminoacyl-tRNA hydrolase [Candidatus Zixiibacteriota bacterium]|jgi:PTH1 family peptidyl-tRNA hydrolase